MTRQTAPDLSGIAAWHTSSYSGSGGNGCVEHAQVPTTKAQAVRDTKDRARGHLRFTAPAWRAFLTVLRGGDGRLGRQP